MVGAYPSPSVARSMWSLSRPSVARSMKNLLNLVFLTVIFGTLTLPSLAFKHARYRPSHVQKQKSYTDAFLTLNDFSRGGDGGDPSECDERFHENTEKIVALSTRWFQKKKACGRIIIIYNPKNGKSVQAKVVDECDSGHGFDKAHAYQPRCGKNIVDGSKAVWTALDIDLKKGKVGVKWAYVNTIGKKKRMKKRKNN